MEQNTSTLVSAQLLLDRLAMPKKRHSTDRLIYQALLSQCATAQLPPPWDNLDVHPSCFQCPADCDATLDELQRTFERRDLLNSGVVVRTRSGDLRLSSYLREPSHYLVALRRKEGGPPFEIIAEFGCISGNEWPVIASMKDFKVREELAEAYDRLLLTFGMQDLVVCLSLGFAASLAVGLEEGLDLLDDLSEQCGWDVRERDLYRGKVSAEEADAEADRFESSFENHFAAMDAAVAADQAEDNPEEGLSPDSSLPSETAAEDAPTSEPSATQGVPEDIPPIGRLRPQPSLSIVLLGWRPAGLSLSEPDDLAPLVERLQTIDEFLGIRMATLVDIWAPNLRSLQVAEKRLEFGVLDGAVDTLRDSFDEEAMSICYYGRQPSESPGDFGEAAAHLREVLRGDTPRNQPFDDAVKDALASFESHLDRDVASPLAEAAVSSADPVKKANYLLAAELARLLHRQVAIVDYRMERAARDITERRDLSPEFENMKGSLALIDRFISVAKVLAR